MLSYPNIPDATRSKIQQGSPLCQHERAADRWLANPPRWEAKVNRELVRKTQPGKRLWMDHAEWSHPELGK